MRDSNPKHSYAHMVASGNAGNMASQSFYGADDIEVRDEDCVIDDSGPITMIKFSDRVHDQIDQSMNQVLIIRLLGRSSGYRTLLSHYVKALTEGPWTIYGSYLTVQQALSRSFSISEKHPSQILAWVRLHGLPYINYSKSLFRRIADAVGKVVRVDYNTQTGGSCTLNAEKKLDGIVMFADDSNMHSMELFDDIQNVKWFGAVSVGILANSANSDEMANQKKEEEENPPMLVQGPACNASNMLAGWHTFNTSPFAGKSSAYIDGRATVLPRMLEWSGFVLNSRLLWKDGDKPDWIKGVDTLDGDIENPLSLNKDPSVVEPVGSFGRQVLLCWHRAEARTDSKFPPRWIIDPPLGITVPSKRTPCQILPTNSLLMEIQ
ncbi:beta-1,4-xylosyltransferase IRX14-like [Hibiscus syriacus]|uniref:beta-1,4-xylosyltransferase IRX14-like n=1 Tax=Hibiscus syriacus TaxID=106335 RepID=UPI001923861C|nr:beta-1,4-xylosyltransferase IRX14-like [Hibiscus syriacus]